MKERTFSSGDYRFGFNGKENDNEVKGDGNQQDYGFRIYDSRLGRFQSVDPITKQYPELTPYQFASNNPIRFIDIDGLEGADPGDVLTGLFSLATSYITAVVEETVTATVEYVRDQISQIEVTPYVKAEVKVTTGARIAGEVNKSAGGDFNAGSVQVFAAKAEVNPATVKQPKNIPEIDYLSKDGKNTATTGVSGNLTSGPAGVGVGVNYSRTKGNDGAVTTTTSQTGGISIGVINASGTREKTLDTKEGTTTTTYTGSVGVGGKLGVCVVVEGDVEVGIRFTNTKETDY